MTVGVMGSSGGIIPSEVAKRVYKLGREIGRRRQQYQEPEPNPNPKVEYEDNNGDIYSNYYEWKMKREDELPEGVK
jgi:hypothetical protein